MKKLVALIGVIAAMMGGTAAKAYATDCPGGYSWGTYWEYQIPTAGNSFSADIIDNGNSTRNNSSGGAYYGDHVIGRLGFQNDDSATTNQIQDGIRTDANNNAEFYLEVAGPGMPEPSSGGPWVEFSDASDTYWDHFWTSGSAPVIGTAYDFTLTNDGSGYYQGSGPGYTSPEVQLGTINNPSSTITNENENKTDNPTCTTYGDYEFFNILPSSYGTGMKNNFQLSHYGVAEFFTHTWTNPDGIVYISIDGF